MCFHTEIKQKSLEIEERFHAIFKDPNLFTPQYYNGFEFPLMPIITGAALHEIQLFHWGLIPHWAKQMDIRTKTLNARIETISEKPAFKEVVHQRCLIPANLFYEWQWLDGRGKRKQKYCLSLPEQTLFGFAGLWSVWQVPTSESPLFTFTMLTGPANDLMAKIHNSKKRMPLIVKKEKEQDWLQNGNLQLDNDLLIAQKIMEEEQPLGGLFG